MSQLRRLVRACLRPLARGAWFTTRPVFRRLYGYFTAPAVSRVEAYGDGLAHMVRCLQARVDALSEQMCQHVSGSINNQTASLHQFVAENDRALLAMLQAPDGSGRAGPALPVSLGGTRLLAAHPALPFMYLDTRDVKATPRVILGAHDDPLAALLPRLVRPGLDVLEVGAGQGFHTLTLAALAGPGGGRVVAFEPDPVRHAVLRDNLAAHDLAGCAEAVAEAVIRGGEWAGRFGTSGPGLVRVGAVAAAGPTLRALAGRLARPDGPSVVLPAGAEPELARGLASQGYRLWSIAEAGTLLPLDPTGGWSPPGLPLLAARGELG